MEVKSHLKAGAISARSRVAGFKSLDAETWAEEAVMGLWAQKTRNSNNAVRGDMPRKRLDEFMDGSPLADRTEWQSANRFIANAQCARRGGFFRRCDHREPLASHSSPPSLIAHGPARIDF
jgi:hypothetical protein